MQNLSTTGVGLYVGTIVYVVVLVGKLLGVEVAEAELTQHITNIVAVVCYMVALYGQFKRKDLKAGIIRK